MRLLRTVGGWLALGLAACLGLVLLAAPAAASLMRFLSIEDLSRASSQVVRARIAGQSVHWTADRQGIYTEIEAVVIGEIKAPPGVPGASRKGAAGAGRSLTIIQAGGEIDGVSLDWTGRPTFREGEDLILFLQPYDPADLSDLRLLVVGGRQGRMRVLEDPQGRSPVMVERELMGVLDAPHFEGVKPTGPAPRRDLLALEELSLRVRAAGGGGR